MYVLTFKVGELLIFVLCVSVYCSIYGLGGNKRDSGTRTFCVIECWTDHRIQISVCE